MNFFSNPPIKLPLLHTKSFHFTTVFEESFFFWTPLNLFYFIFISILSKPHFFSIYFLSNHPKQVEDFKLYVIDIKIHSNWIWLTKVIIFLIKNKKLGLKMYTMLEGAIKFKHTHHSIKFFYFSYIFNF